MKHSALSGATNRQQLGQTTSYALIHPSPQIAGSGGLNQLLIFGSVIIIIFMESLELIEDHNMVREKIVWLHWPCTVGVMQEQFSVINVHLLTKWNFARLGFEGV